MSTKNLEMLNIYIIIDSGMLSRDKDENMRKTSSKIAIYEKLNQRKKEIKKKRGEMVTDIPDC